MRRKIDYDKLCKIVEETEAKLECCPFCGHPAHIENNVGSWNGESEFQFGCSNKDCFMYYGNEKALDIYDVDECEEIDLDTMTGLKKMLYRMMKMWNHRASNCSKHKTMLEGSAE